MIKPEDIKVKPLEWSKSFSPNDHCSYDHCYSNKTSIGIFQIEWKSWKEFDGRVLTLNDQHIDAFDSVEQAKQAANDYVRNVVMQLIEAE